MAKVKSFFKPNTGYSDEGGKLAIEIDKILEPLYKKIANNGYNTRELTQIIQSSITTFDVVYSMDIREKIDKINRVEKASRDIKAKQLEREKENV